MPFMISRLEEFPVFINKHLCSHKFCDSHSVPLVCCSIFVLSHFLKDSSYFLSNQTSTSMFFSVFDSV